MINRAIFLIALALLYGCGKPAQPNASGKLPERIISLAPNITETIYALGLEGKLVGVTTCCLYPAAAQLLPKIGGFGNVNYEAVLALKPGLVILHKEYDADKARLDGLGIPYLETGTYFIADILDTIRDIGAACGAEERANELVGQLNRRIDELRSKNSDRPRVLITFGVNDDPDSFESIQAFGTACLHNELLDIAGGQNVIEGHLPFATLSREAMLRLNPDIIIQLSPEQKPVDDPVKAWKQLDAVNAVRNHRIHMLSGDYTCIPGPRFIQILEDFAGIIRQNGSENHE